ncbi:MAG: paraquat-inducible membrane protein A [Deltaproteobacteria bacterium]|nr:paraquat-inducible membrane protein A [Deltaproteobacteria bacterium]
MSQIDISNCETAREADLGLCHDCHKLMPMEGRHEVDCPRCGARIHLRKPGSISRTWALVLTALILSFPANFLPIMEVNFLGTPDASTIMDGIIYFFKEGSYGIGAIILTASILVPCFKIIGLILILLSIQFHWKSWLRHKTILFRIIEFIGRWSMLDIFVIALLQVLVNFGYITSISAAPASTYFTGVVLSTMFAAITFDSRLLWDA